MDQVIASIKVRNNRELLYFLYFKTYLVVFVKPKKCEIGNSYRFPMIRNLLSCAINNVRHFVCDYKFKILYKLKYFVRRINMVSRLNSIF